jgi:hypothetical protein
VANSVFSGALELALSGGNIFAKKTAGLKKVTIRGVKNRLRGFLEDEKLSKRALV